jgi:hypothetical protein
VNKTLAAFFAIFLAMGAMAAPTVTSTPQENPWVLPKTLCNDFSAAAAKACVASFAADTHDFKDIDENGKKNILEICAASRYISNTVCSEGAVKLNRSSVQAFCADVSLSYGVTASMGCEKVVRDSSDLNPPEDVRTMLEACQVLGQDVRERTYPACVKRFSEKGLPPKLTPDPEPKAAPKSTKPPPFKPGEEMSI